MPPRESRPAHLQSLAIQGDVISETSHTLEPDRPHASDRLAWWFLALGSCLRVVWPLDMEWKYDEQWMFAHAVDVAQGRAPWPWVGMASGVKLQNPGLSVWPFILLARVTQDPVVMTQAVQFINVAALWGLSAWVARTWSRRDRAIGLWGVALFAVSPLAVLFSRKLWAQDLLIVLVLPWLWGHRTRARVWGAFVWGLFGALLGQLHMSGFFAAFALAAVTCLWQWRGLAPERTHFRAWFAGSALGALPLLPWLYAIFSEHTSGVANAQARTLHFFTHALRHAFGLGLAYPLGRDYHAFLRGPTWAGVQTHLNDAARYGLLLLLGVAVLAQLDALRKHKRLQLPEPVGLYLSAVLCTGVLLIAARVQVYAHYLIVFGPLLHIGAAFALYPRRWALIAVCALQAWLSAQFLVFVHDHGGAPQADYGKTYRVQSAAERDQLPR